MKNELWPARKRWMVVDDTPAVLEAVAMILESLDAAEVLRFNSAEDALEAYSADPDAFELIVTDLNMPSMDGAELCAAVHALNWRQPVLLATGSSDLTTAEALDAGFIGLLRKPFAVRDLLLQLQNANVLDTPEPQKIDTLFTVRASLSLLSPAWA